jgi:hemerythrin-like domain-containing protein
MLERDHEKTNRKLDDFENTLTNLCYEGKVSLGKNLRHGSDALRYFQDNVGFHMKLEEGIVFPFVRICLPKLEPVISLLCSEHQDFRSSLKTLRGYFARLAGAKSLTSRTRCLGLIKEKGTYLIYLLRHHLQAESESVYKAMANELREDEKKELEKRIKNFCARRNAK